MDLAASRSPSWELGNYRREGNCQGIDPLLNRLVFATPVLLILGIYLVWHMCEILMLQRGASYKNKCFRRIHLQERTNACQRVPILESVGDNPTLSAISLFSMG